MDFRARESAWLLQADAVFKGGISSGESTEKESFIEIKEASKLILHKRTKAWWNKMFLEHYITKGMIPRGLRI